MKQVYRFLLNGLLLTTFLPMCAQDNQIVLTPINQELVAKQCVSIKKEMDLHRKLRMGLQAAGASLIVYQLYVMAKAFGFVGKKNEQKQQDNRAQLAPNNGEKKNWSATIKDFFTSRDTYTMLASSGLELGSMVVFQKALEELQRRVFESDTIAWITSQRAPIRTTYAELQQWIHCIVMIDQDTLAHAAYIRASFVSTMKTLVHQIEMILGYMHYKAHRLHAQHMHEAQNIIQELTHETNGCITAIEECFNIEDINKMVELLDELQRTIELECMHFARIEGSMWHDRGEIPYRE